MRRIRSQNLESGFTLIEVLIYAVIIVFFMASVIWLAFSLIQTSERTLARQELIENSQLMMRKLEWALRGAKDVNVPIVGESGALLSVDTFHDINNPYKFDLANGKFRVTRGNNTPTEITNDFVRVATISFETFQFSEQSFRTIRFKALVESEDPRVTSSISLDTFITVR